jgi:hypothetical protein
MITLKLVTISFLILTFLNLSTRIFQMCHQYHEVCRVNSLRSVPLNSMIVLVPHRCFGRPKFRRSLGRGFRGQSLYILSNICSSFVGRLSLRLFSFIFVTISLFLISEFLWCC